jgi:hypothetical protein
VEVAKRGAKRAREKGWLKEERQATTYERKTVLGRAMKICFLLIDNMYRRY